MKLHISLGLLALSGSSFAAIITFDEPGRADGDIMSNQYAGVTFSAGLGGATGVSLTNSTQGTFGTDMSMDLTTTDVGGGVTAPVSNRLLHSFGGWLGESNDPVFRLDFTDDISAISMDFGGIFNDPIDISNVRVFAVNSSNVAFASVAATTAGSSTVSLTGFGMAKSFIVTPGSFDDWVGVDNINFTPVPVPEPASLTMLGLGFAALLRKRKK